MYYIATRKEVYMLSITDSAKALRACFKKNRVATLPELLKILKTSSRISVYNRLNALGYLSSYSHNGIYYTLSDIPVFDEAGLWQYDGIGFSKAGNLKATIATLVHRSPAGYTLNELEKQLNVRVQNAPLYLVREEKITREISGGVYLYLSAKRERCEEQKAARYQFRIPGGEQLPGWLVIDVLTTAIREYKLDMDSASIVKSLGDRGRYVTLGQVEHILCVFTEKKTTLHT